MADNMYKNGKIYKLVNDVDDKIYIGSSCNVLATRLNQHKAKSKCYPDRHVYKHLNEIGWESVKIILVEDYPCDTKKHLEARERHWIDTLKPELNKQFPTRTKVEYRIDNKEKIAEYKQQYRIDNKEKIAEYHQQYYNENRTVLLENRKIKYECSCGGCYTTRHKSSHEKSKKHQQWLSNQIQ